MVKVAGNTFVVTGGSSGLGLGVTIRFAEQGANVIVVDLAPPPETSDKVFYPGKTDVTSEEAVRDAIKQGIEKFGPLSGAVLCAGIFTPGLIAALPEHVAPWGMESMAGFRKKLEINVLGSFNVAQVVAQHLIDTHKDKALGHQDVGSIILTSSYVSTDGQSGAMGYTATKGAISAMVLPMARDLARYNIRVNAIAPGVFLTPINDMFISETSKCGEFPQRPGRPDEFAHLAQTLLENEMMNAAVVRHDGGLRGAISI